MRQKLLTAFLVLYCGAASAATFTYKMYSYPAHNIQTCLPAARAIAEKLQAAAGVTITSTLCQGEEFSDGMTILLSYSAEDELPITSTESKPLDFTPRGFYVSKAECDAALKSQEDIFTAETGLTPFASFCFKTGFDHAREWAFNIGAVGNAERKPFYASAIADSLPKSPEPAAVARDFGAYFATKGGKLYKTAFKNSDSRQIVFFYYGPAAIDFRSEYFGPFPSLLECQKLQRYIDPAMKAAAPESKFAGSYCGISSDVSLQMVWDDYVPRTTYSVEIYNSYEQCEAARTNLLAVYQEQYGARLIGGVCTREYNTFGFHVALFTAAAAD